MKVEWDETKRIKNIQKHKIDFVDSDVIFDDFTVTFQDNSDSYGEQRFVTFGLFQGRVVAVVHTEREDNIRVISIRKATKHEEKNYYAAIPN